MHLFVACCNSQEMLHSKFVWSMFQNMNTPYSITMHRASHPWTTIRNNRAILEFIRSGADIMVKMDVDQIYPENYFLDMVPLVQTYGMIGPLIYDRHDQNDYKTLAFGNKDDVLGSWIDTHGEVGIAAYPYTHTNNFYTRELITCVEPPWYEFYPTKNGFEKGNHVDFDFLDKIKETGQRCWINHDVIVKHIAICPVDGDFYEKHRG